MAETHDGAHPWQVDNAPRQLNIRLQAYVAAMKRAERWDGGSLTRRRAELRDLAAAAGREAQLEIILAALEKQHAEIYSAGGGP